ncbi:MAG: DUF448 domain-containing protein [Proteobacteria bacterium]|nr:DUF448 domain-containing protein [Pseudomonadota bacterium]
MMTDKSRLQDECTVAEQETAQPQRRCICCRGNGKKHALLRFAVLNNTLVFDLRKKLPGRGYYVCAQMHCLEKAFKQGFKRVTKHDAAELADNTQSFVREIVLPGLKKRYTECLLAGFQSHQLLLGSDSVEEAAKSDALACYILATDASPSTTQKYRTNAERKKLPCIGLETRAFYGQLFGKSDKVVLGWLSGTLCDEFMSLEMSIRHFEETISIE